MKSKRELQDEAKQLLENDPSKSVEVCLGMHTNYPSEFNNYDAINLLQAARASKRVDIDNLREIIENFKDYEIVSSLCGWYVFDNFIKHKTPQLILNSENLINSYVNIIKQKDISVDDKYPCPFSIILFNLIEAHSNNLFNANKIYEYCKKINSEFLSKKTSEFKDKEGKTKENPSDSEKYYQYYTKACDKLNKSLECIEACNSALHTLTNFHYDNDLWFNMRIARAHHNLKDYTSSERLYLEIINSRAGSTKYFLFKEYSELLYEQKRYDDSWIQSLRSGVQLYDVKFCAGLCLLQSRILARMNRIDEAKRFAEVIFYGVREEVWNNSSEYQKLINYFHVDDVEESLNSLFKDLYKFYKDELYDNSDIHNGEIVFVHPKGKFGKIKYGSNNTINFSKNCFNKRIRGIDKYKGAKISFVSDFNFNSEPIAENIKIINLKEPEILVGKTMTGKIQNIVDFGLFVDLENGKTGLAHISVLSPDFKELFSVGDTLKVLIDKETDKGISLKIKK